MHIRERLFRLTYYRMDLLQQEWVYSHLGYIVLFFYRSLIFPSRKHAYIMLTALKPHFYVVKLGFTGVYIIIFLFLLKNIDCGYPLEPPRRGGSNEYPQSMFWAEIWKISIFYFENLHFVVVKCSVYLHRFVFVIERERVCWKSM